MIFPDKYGTTRSNSNNNQRLKNRHVYVHKSPAKSISPRQFKRTNQISATHCRGIRSLFTIYSEAIFSDFHSFPFQILKLNFCAMVATAEAQKPTAEIKVPAVKVKKPKAAAKEKELKAAKTSSHPPYFEMIKEALLALNEKGGSSPYAIAKYMEEKHKSVLPENFRKILGLQLKNSTVKGKLIKIKASFKLSDAGRKDNPKPKPKIKTKPAAVTKKTAATKATAKKPKSAPAAKKATAASVGTKRKAVAKGVKKVAPKKAAAAKPKQPKSIKSPAAKKTKRVKA